MTVLTRRAVLTCCAIVLLCLGGPDFVQAQAPDPGVRPVTRTFAIKDARVVQAPGRVLERATVIVRNGQIEAVGTDVPVPFDAQVIEGDTLVVYAGFIDAFTSAGVETPAVDTSERIADPMNAPRDRTGVLPDRLARQHLNPADPALKQLRDAGFTAAHVAPTRGLFSGQSAVILTAGDRAEDLVLHRESSLVVRFEGGSGVFPSTPMGVAAVIRERYRQADQAREGGNRRRPAFDPVADALRPSLERQQPVFFVAGDVLEGQRALHLGQELNLDVVLVGVPESSMLVDRLRERRVRAIAPLALPDTVAADTAWVSDPTEDLAAHLGGQFFVTDRRTRSYLDVEEERRDLAARRAIAIATFERNPLTLQEAGVEFAFATLGQSPGASRANLRRMIRRGLTPDQALAALTTTPARMLGLERTLGTVEAGKMANLIISQGNLFEQDGRILYVFVDGNRFEVSPPAAAVDPDAEISLLGTWDVTVVTPEAPFSGQMVFAGTEEAPTGRLTLEPLGTLTIEEIRVEGNRLTFAIPGSPLGRLEGTATVAGDNIEGEVRAPGFPPATMTATRRPN